MKKAIIGLILTVASLSTYTIASASTYAFDNVTGQTINAPGGIIDNYTFRAGGLINTFTALTSGYVGSVSMPLAYAVAPGFSISTSTVMDLTIGGGTYGADNGELNCSSVGDTIGNWGIPPQPMSYGTLVTTEQTATWSGFSGSNCMLIAGHNYYVHSQYSSQTITYSVQGNTDPYATITIAGNSFDTLRPAGLQVVASSTVTFTGNYFYDSTGTTTYDNLRLSITDMQNYFNDATSTVDYGTNTLVPNAYTSFSRTVPLQDGHYYQWRLMFENTQTGETFSSAFQRFYTVYNPAPLSGAWQGPVASQQYVAYSQCDQSFFGTQTLCKVLVWLFYPSTASESEMQGLQTQINSTAPFGYVSLFISTLQGVNTGSAQSYTITIPTELKQNVFDPIKTALGILLVFFFVVHFYKRLKNINI